MSHIKAKPLRSVPKLISKESQPLTEEALLVFAQSMMATNRIWIDHRSGQSDVQNPPKISSLEDLKSERFKHILSHKSDKGA